MLTCTLHNNAQTRLPNTLMALPTAPSECIPVLLQSVQILGKKGKWSSNFNYIFCLKKKMKKVRQSFDLSINKYYAYLLSSPLYYWFVRNYIWSEREKIHHPTKWYKNGTKWAPFRLTSILPSLWRVQNVQLACTELYLVDTEYKMFL